MATSRSSHAMVPPSSSLTSRASLEMKVLPPPRKPTRVLTRGGSSDPNTARSSARTPGSSTSREFTRAIPKPDNPRTGPCRISLRTVKRVGAPSGRMAPPSTSKVTSCSERNQPRLYFCSTIPRVGAALTSASRPRPTRSSATLPMTHGAARSSTANTRTAAMMRFMETSGDFRGARELRVECLEPLDGADVVPLAVVQLAAQRALRDRALEERQQRKPAGDRAIEELRRVDPDSRVRVARPLALRDPPVLQPEIAAHVLRWIRHENEMGQGIARQRTAQRAEVDVGPDVTVHEQEGRRS